MMVASRSRSTVLALIVLAAIQRASGQCPPSYSVEIYAGPQCQFLPASAGARAINDAGDLGGGYLDCGENGHPVIWSADGSIIELPDSADGGSPGIHDVNIHSEACGILWVPMLNQDRAFRYSDGVTTNLGTLGGDLPWSEAFAISDGGRVIGYSSGCLECPGLHAVLWENDVATILDLPLGPNRIAYDISDSGEFICGWMGIAPNPQFGSHAFIWNNAKVIDLGTPLPESDSTEARGVNNLGQACGYAYFALPEGYIRAFFWSDRQMQQIDPLPGYENSFALDLNDMGQVIGRCNNGGGSGPAFIWQSGSIANLANLISAELNLSFLTVSAINNAGQIAGSAKRPGPNGTDTVAIRLTPIPSATGDFNGDCANDWADILNTIKYWHDPKGPGRMADYDADGDVNVLDLIIVIHNWSA